MVNPRGSSQVVGDIMRFLADMGVANKVVEWLKEKGQDAIHLREQSLQRLPNGDIFKKAILEKRVVLTFDLDFGEIIALSENKTTSAIIFRLRNTRAIHVIERLDRVLQGSSDAIEKGSIISVEEDRYRIRYLPIDLKEIK